MGGWWTMERKDRVPSTELKQDQQAHMNTRYEGLGSLEREFLIADRLPRLWSPQGHCDRACLSCFVPPHTPATSVSSSPACADPEG